MCIPCTCMPVVTAPSVWIFYKKPAAPVVGTAFGGCMHRSAWGRVREGVSSHAHACLSTAVGNASSAHYSMQSKHCPLCKVARNPETPTIPNYFCKLIVVAYTHTCTPGKSPLISCLFLCLNAVGQVVSKFTTKNKEPIVSITAHMLIVNEWF